jgi:hypothetical protein
MSRRSRRARDGGADRSNEQAGAGRREPGGPGGASGRGERPLDAGRSPSAASKVDASRGGGRSAAGSGASGGTGAAPDAPGRPPYRIRPAAQVAILVAVFALTTLIAELAGAVNLGTALGIGQIAFAIALIVVLLRS